MLWSRGLIEEPDYRPVVGMDSFKVHGVFAHGWPVRLAPHQRLAIGVRPTCKDGRLKRYAVAITAGFWQDGSWQLIGACTGLAPGEATEARAWFFGCWLILQATLVRRLTLPIERDASTKAVLAPVRLRCGTVFLKVNGHA